MNLAKSLVHQLFSKCSLFSERRHKPDSRKKFYKVSHCIFDLDGAILDNHEVLGCAHNAVFEKYDLEYTPKWELKLMGMSGKEMWGKVIKDLRVNAEWQQMYDDYRRIINGALVDAPLRPGVVRLIEHLEEHQVPIAAVTSSSESVMIAKTRHISDLMSKFSHVVCGEGDPHVTKSKPSNEIYEICALRFFEKPNPITCLVFEDSPNGVSAALNASMQVVGVPCPPTPPVALKHADEVINSLDDFWPGKYGIPPFPEQREPPIPY